jgi:quercetin dioxygenase-like cupin family protein
MLLVRRRFLHLTGAALALPAAARMALAQAAPATPQLTLLLKADLQGQDQKVQETVVNVLEMAPGVGAPWHMHPGAQEIIFVLNGDLVVEVEGQGTKAVKVGEIILIPAEIPHLARNDSASIVAKALVTHSRADKDKPFVVVRTCGLPRAPAANDRSGTRSPRHLGNAMSTLAHPPIDDCSLLLDGEAAEVAQLRRQVISSRSRLPAISR